jgi:Zn-dependent protease
MKWSWKIGELAGIGVFVHATFFLILVWIAVSNLARGSSLPVVASAVGFTLALFACVVLHEFGHALTAARYGIATRDITLLPIGGVARLERMPDDPKQELWVALAGPAVNVVIAGAIYVWLSATRPALLESGLDVTGGPFLERLMIVNLFLVAFNMLPAFPMDGGRVLRALLATRVEYTRATQIAATIGQGMALALGFAGLYGNPVLIFIALFVWIGAAQEASLVQMKAALSGIPVRRAMLTDFRTLSPHDPLSRAIELTLAGSQHDFPVVDGGRVAGILTRANLLKAVAENGRAVTVGSVMGSDFQAADPAEMLEAAFLRLQSCECHTMPVVSRGELVGLLTAENIGEFLMFESALGRSTSG